jgi:adenylylsulfate kinase
MDGVAIWITGLPGSGKSTLAEEIQRFHPEFSILSMDTFRKIVSPDPSYSEAERDTVYRALIFTAMKMTELGHHVIIDATGNRLKWRELARELIVRYREIYLKCPIDICMDRENKRSISHDAPKDIYKKGMSGWPVPGISVSYEEPVKPDLTLETEKMTLREMRDLVEKVILSP